MQDAVSHGLRELLDVQDLTRGPPDTVSHESNLNNETVQLRAQLEVFRTFLMIHLRTQLEIP